MSTKWVMIRVPETLKTELMMHGLAMAMDLEPKQQGNHEDNRSWDAPLWRVIGELLRRDKDHRKRGNRNSGSRKAKARFTNEGGIVGGVPDSDAASEGGVYTGRQEGQSSGEGEQ